MPLNESIDQVTIDAFSDTYFELASQTVSRTRPMVRVVPINSENVLLNRVGTIEAQDISERAPEIKPQDVKFDRRRLSTKRIGAAALWDEYDDIKTLGDPSSVLVKRMVEAVQRDVDRTIIAAATAPVLTGREGTTLVTAAADGVQEIDATDGFGYETLLAITAKLSSKEIGTETPVMKWLLISEQEEEQLMKDGTLINGDFTNRYVVDQGRIKQALDFNLVVFGSDVPNPMLQEANGERSCICLVTDAIYYGVARDARPQIKDRNDRWDTQQILCSAIHGAVRMDGPRVIKVKTRAA